MIGYPKRREDLILRETGDEVAIYDPSSATLVQLNASALAIWQACDGRTSQEEIADALAVLTGLDAGALLSEVETTISTFVEQGLLERQ